MQCRVLLYGVALFIEVINFLEAKQDVSATNVETQTKAAEFRNGVFIETPPTNSFCKSFEKYLNTNVWYY